MRLHDILRLYNIIPNIGPCTNERCPPEWALRSPLTVINYHVMKTFLRSLTRPAVASAIVALALTGLLYGDALTLPLFSDDLLQIPWLETVSWRQLWSSPSPYGYYRPLWYTLWHLWGGLFGGLHPPGLHFLNLSAHFVAAHLAGLLAAAWIRPPVSKSRDENVAVISKSRGMESAPTSCFADSRRFSRTKGKISVHQRSSAFYSACLATALFAAFPFSRQAIAWPGAVYNPLVSAMAAGAILAYDRGRKGHGTRWIGLALLLAALSPFTYESGMLVGPLVVLIEGVGWMQQRWQRRSWWPLAFAGLFLATFAVWRTMRGTDVVGFGLTLSDLRRNAGYLVQGLTYPTAPLAQRLVARWGLDPEVSLHLIALPALALLVWSGLRWNRGAFCVGAIWFVLFALPPMVSMEADWFALAPRFLYMTASGIALMWTAAASAWLARLRSSWRAVAAATLLVALITPAVVFVRDGVRLYAMTGESIWGAAEAALRERPVLLVNLPMRITPTSRTYPLGFEGVTPLPARVTAEGLVYVHTGIHDAAEAVAFGIVAVDEPPDYTYQLFGRPAGWEELADTIRQARAVHLTRYEPDRIHLIEAGAAGEIALPGEPLTRFGERVALLDAVCTCDEAGQVHLTAHWRAEADVERDMTVFAHLLGPEGTLVTQADGHPLLGMFPFWLWQPGEVVRDVRHFDTQQPGEYSVALGVWDPTSGARLPATAADGSSWPDQAIRVGPCVCGSVESTR